MKKAIYQKWLERVKYDIDTAEAMYATRRYIYAVFICQQALEKCFKALMAFKGIEILPVHNLRRLAEMIDVIGELSHLDLKKMDFLSQYYLNARYKEDIEELLSQITDDIAIDFL
ncbi:HEPN domain-containing protein, partial [bacterium]|nr:HEPN domain-containing protein [bacterium]